MVYRGRVKAGVVVFEDGVPPDGAAVTVQVVPPETPEPTVWQKLRKYSGAAKGLPADFARNHDHYIRGAPKR